MNKNTRMELEKQNKNTRIKLEQQNKNTSIKLEQQNKNTWIKLEQQNKNTKIELEQQNKNTRIELEQENKNTRIELEQQNKNTRIELEQWESWGIRKVSIEKFRFNTVRKYWINLIQVFCWQRLIVFIDKGKLSLSWQATYTSNQISETNTHTQIKALNFQKFPYLILVFIPQASLL